MCLHCALRLCHFRRKKCACEKTLLSFYYSWIVKVQHPADYGIAPPDLPQRSDGCEAKFSWQHALACKKGGLIINEI
jgi:hypothetical protein